MNEMVFGLLLVILAGFLQGSFALFFKYTKPLFWEQYWSIYVSIALLLFPTLLAIFTVPNFANLLNLSQKEMFLPLLFGGIWGIGSVLFGLSVERIGISLSLSIVLGIVTVIGTVIPLFIDKPQLTTLQLILLLVGLVVIVLGVALSGYSGKLRDKAQGKATKASLFGIMIASIAGFFSSFINVAFTLGKPLGEVAHSLGATNIISTFYVWAIVLFAGWVVNIAYAGILMVRNNTVRIVPQLGKKNLLAAIMAGIFWYGAFISFGIASLTLGKLGSSVGWAIFIAVAIVIANLWGVKLGEWKKAEKALRYQMYSVGFITLGVILIAASVLVK